MQKAKGKILDHKKAPVLRQAAKPVPLKDIGTKKLGDVIARMKTALAAQADGVAIAAPQIGESLRIFVVSGKIFQREVGQKPETPQKKVNDLVFINPVIVKMSRKKLSMEEGCLSVRWLYGNVLRSEKTTVRALDEKGKKFEMGGSGLLSQIFQHETDHLDGILFIDKATNLRELPPEQKEPKPIAKRAKKDGRKNKSRN